MEEAGTIVRKDARDVVDALHSVHVVTVESESEAMTRPGAIVVACNRPDGLPAEVVMPREGLPPLDVLRDAIAAGPDGRTSRCVLQGLAGRGGFAGAALQRIEAGLSRP